jgi:hypothetical protein
LGCGHRAGSSPAIPTISHIKIKRNMELSTEIILAIENYDLQDVNFVNLGELTAEDYCLKIGKQLEAREINITSSEFLSEIKRYFKENPKEEYILMDIVKHFIKLYNG